MKKHLSSFTTWLLPLVTIGLLVVVPSFVLWPWLTQVLAIHKQFPIQRQRLVAVNTKLETLSSQDEAQLTSYLVNLEVILPTEPQPPLTLGVLESLANTAGLKVNSTQFTKIQDGQVRAELAAEGSYDKLTALLAELETSAPLIKMNSFKLSQSTGGTGNAPGQTTTIFSAGEPFQEVPTNLGSVEDPVVPLSPEDLAIIEKLKSLKVLLQPVQQDQVDSLQKGKSDPFH